MTARSGIVLSKRLRCVTDCVRAVAARFSVPPRLLDVGCDHGLVTADLIITNDIESATASDLREGPLEAARATADRFGISDRIRFVRTDGLNGMGENTAEICVIAGMGGELIRDILRAGEVHRHGIQYLVLSPHTKAGLLRRHLKNMDFTLLSEDMLEEDGKFYPVLTISVPELSDNKIDCYEVCVSSITDVTGCVEADALRVAFQYGPLLLTGRDRTLHRYLLKQRTRLETIRRNVPAGAQAAVYSIERELRDAETALALYGNID